MGGEIGDEGLEELVEAGLVFGGDDIDFGGEGVGDGVEGDLGFAGGGEGSEGAGAVAAGGLDLEFGAFAHVSVLWLQSSTG